MSKCDFTLAINGFKFKISGQGKASFGTCYKKLTPSSLSTRDVVVANFFSNARLFIKGVKRRIFR